MRRRFLLVALLCAFPARAEIRVQRVIDWRSGLPSSFTVQIEQDPAGFLWFTTTGGVVRYDGNEARVVAPAPIGFLTGSVTVGRPIFVRPRAVGLGEIVDEAGKPVAEPRPGSPLLSACVTPDGTLWGADAHGLWVREGSAWRGPMLLPGGRSLEGRVWGWGKDRVVAADDDQAYVVTRDGAATPLAPARGLVTVARKSDGTAILGCWRRDGGHVLEVRDGRWREIQSSGSRLMAVACRGDVVWIAYDGILIRIPPGGAQEVIGPVQGFPGGGPMLVDREGSLWIATIHGVLQYPEPETTSLVDRFTIGTRDLARTPEVVWVSSWSGLLIHHPTDPARSAMSKASYIDPVCVAADGAVWTLAPGRFFRHDPAGGGYRAVAFTGPDAPVYAHKCGEGREGRIWFPTDAGLFVLGPGDAAPRHIAVPPPPPNTIWVAAAEDGDGNLWIGVDDRVCRAPAARALGGERPSWSCETVPGMLHLSALRSMPSGDLWAATDSAGVWRRHGGRFTPIAASAGLGSPVTRALVPSPSGGLWIVGEVNCVRVEERAGTPAGWEVMERVGVWQGLPTSGLMDLAEDADGTLWLATDMSLVRMPPEARNARPEPPPVAVVEASVDGKPIPTAGEVALPYGKNRLEVRFAALSYREPALIRYRTRLRPQDPWSEPTAQSSFRFVDLPAGHYRIEVQASLDGKRWSPTEVAVAARVLPPWWKRAWFVTALLVLLLAVLAAAYRLRVRQLLRLERQRTQIAMDLHDAIGSGLGSIRILSGLAIRETTPDATRATVSARIAEISDDLAVALGDIVWSLRPGTGSLEALGSQLVARATPLVTAHGMTLETLVPSAAPEVPLSLAVRRHVFLVGLEAVHNAARHSKGSRIVLSIERTGRRWTLRVEDDGQGLQSRDPGSRPGLGLESIQRRAAEIGADARWESRPGGGTLFTLTFDARADASHTHATGARGRPPASSEQP